MADPRRSSRIDSQSLPPAARISARLALNADGALFGWAFDPRDYERRFVVEILGDGVRLAIVQADMHVDQLRQQGHWDGCYGFAIALDPRLRIEAYELRLANDDHVIASYAGSGSDAALALAAFSSGTVLWLGGLRLSGTIRDHRAERAQLPVLQAHEGSRCLDTGLRLHVHESDALGGTHYQFDLLLPVELADGVVHQVRVVNGAGVELEGSPVAVLAHKHGFHGLLPTVERLPKVADTLRRQTLETLDRLIPGSLPFECYAGWNAAFGDDEEFAGVISDRVFGVVIVGRSESEATLESLRRQRGRFLLRAVILDAEAGDHASFSRQAWRAVRASLVGGQPPAATMIVRAGTTLKPPACLALAGAIDTGSGDGGHASLYVADHELFARDGEVMPFFGPAFDYERLLSQGYAEGFFAVSSLPELAGDPAGLVSAYDVLLSALEQAQAEQGVVVQIPRIVASVPRLPSGAATVRLADAVRAHLARSGQPATIEAGQGMCFPVVHVRRPRPEGEVAIIIPTRDRLDLLKPCVASVQTLTDHPNYRIVIVDNGSREQETLDYFRDLSRQGAIVLRDDRVFNYARLNNLAITEIASPFACLLNNDVEALAPDWLGGMQSFFSRRDVGAVGAKLVWPNGMLQHGGVVLGMNFAAGHAYDRYLADEPGYADGILAARECSALTAACLLVRRGDFLRAGGFDETAFPVAFNDVDLCLKLREAGKTLIWSPHAQLLHRESASRMSDRDCPAKQARFAKELAELRRRWGHRLVSDDCYNPNLNLDAYGFTGLALPPRDRAFRARMARF